jgi:hypothetical protein
VERREDGMCVVVLRVILMGPRAIECCRQGSHQGRRVAEVTATLCGLATAVATSGGAKKLDQDHPSEYPLSVRTQFEMSLTLTHMQWS